MHNSITAATSLQLWMKKNAFLGHEPPSLNSRIIQRWKHHGDASAAPNIIKTMAHSQTCRSVLCKILISYRCSLQALKQHNQPPPTGHHNIGHHDNDVIAHTLPLEIQTGSDIHPAEQSAFNRSPTSVFLQLQGISRRVQGARCRLQT